MSTRTMKRRRNTTTKRTRARASRPRVPSVATWQDLGSRFRDVMIDLVKDGKAFERGLEPKLLPALRRLKSDVQRLITKLELRARRRAS